MAKNKKKRRQKQKVIIKSEYFKRVAPFYAELIRSSIDCVNHLVLLVTNLVKMDASKKYPYGMLNKKTKKHYLIFYYRYRKIEKCCLLTTCNFVHWFWITYHF